MKKKTNFKMIDKVSTIAKCTQRSKLFVIKLFSHLYNFNICWRNFMIFMNFSEFILYTAVYYCHLWTKKLLVLSFKTLPAHYYIVWYHLLHLLVCKWIGMNLWWCNHISQIDSEVRDKLFNIPNSQLNYFVVSTLHAPENSH